MNVINICKYNQPNKRIENFQMNKKKKLKQWEYTKAKKNRLKFWIK
jgi:hypothetical protein